MVVPRAHVSPNVILNTLAEVYPTTRALLETKNHGSEWEFIFQVPYAWSRFFKKRRRKRKKRQRTYLSSSLADRGQQPPLLLLGPFAKHVDSAARRPGPYLDLYGVLLHVAQRTV